jgi:hypothetical protein
MTDQSTSPKAGESTWGSTRSSFLSTMARLAGTLHLEEAWEIPTVQSDAKYPEYCAEFRLLLELWQPMPLDC